MVPYACEVLRVHPDCAWSIVQPLAVVPGSRAASVTSHSDRFHITLADELPLGYAVSLEKGEAGDVSQACEVGKLSIFRRYALGTAEGPDSLGWREQWRKEQCDRRDPPAHAPAGWSSGDLLRAHGCPLPVWCHPIRIGGAFRGTFCGAAGTPDLRRHRYRFDECLLRTALRR